MTVDLAPPHRADEPYISLEYGDDDCLALSARFLSRFLSWA